MSFLDNKKLHVREVLENAIKKNRASLVLKNKDVVRLTAMDVRPKDDIAILLFRRSDPEAATPIFEDERTRKLRKSDKKPTEAIAVSAHMFIRLGGIEDAGHPTYRAILEEVPGLSRTYVQTLLHDIVKDIRYEYTDKRGEKKRDVHHRRVSRAEVRKNRRRSQGPEHGPVSYARSPWQREGA
jgi:hypothetical protein